MGKHDHRDHLTDIEAGRNVTWAGMAVNALLIAMKIFGGTYGRSRALLADAVHSISDFISDILVLIGLHFFQKEEDSGHPYGHGKIETLATIGVGLLLLYAAVHIGINAAVAVYRGDIGIPHRFTIMIAAASIATKEILYHVTVRVGKRIRSEAMIANAWHHRSDAWTSVVTLAGVTLAVYVPSLRVLDSYAALLVSYFIIRVAFGILRGAIAKIVDTSPDPELIDRICDEIRSVEGVRNCHDVAARYYADRIRMEIHIAVDPTLTVLEAHGIADTAATRIKDQFEEVSSVLVHIDPYEG